MNEFIDRLINTTAGWLASIGPDSRVVHSTRVRLARNLEKISFPRPSGSDIGVVERIKEEAKRIHSESFSLKKMTIIDFDLISHYIICFVPRFNLLKLSNGILDKCTSPALSI